MSAQRRDRAIDLLGEHHTRELVRKRHGREREQQVCESIFKALTDKATDPRGVRRPTTFGTLCELADATPAEVRSVIEVFRKPSRSFLMPPAEEELEAETVIDISHESLMRVWRRLSTWADEEREFTIGKQQLERDLHDWELVAEAEKSEVLWGGLKLSRERIADVTRALLVGGPCCASVIVESVLDLFQDRLLAPEALIATEREMP